MKMKILLFGATGMAGHVAYCYLKSTGKYDIVNVVYRTKLTEDSIVVDITNQNRVIETIKSQNPDIILNCIGVLVKGSKNHVTTQVSKESIMLSLTIQEQQEWHYI